jgi:hypothetical protein
VCTQVSHTHTQLKMKPSSASASSSSAASAASSSSGGGGGSSSAIHEARAITSSLQRVRQNISMGVTQADTAVGLLTEDDDKINSTLDLHQYDLKSALSLTKTRLHKLRTIEVRERRFLSAALVFFTSVVVFIVFRRTRILYLILLTLSLIPKPSPSTAPSSSIRNESLVPMNDSISAQDILKHNVLDDVIDSNKRDPADQFEVRHDGSNSEYVGENIEEVMLSESAAECASDCTWNPSPPLLLSSANDSDNVDERPVDREL